MSLADLDLAPLSADGRGTLEAAVVELRARHAAALKAAIDHAMDQVPRVLRGALKKVLFT